MQDAKRPLLGNSAITLHLQELGYPQKSIDSMLKCGTTTGFKMFSYCNCEFKVIPMTHHCNLRTCPICAKKRKRKIVRQYRPFLGKLAQDRTNFLYFLTISPQNYSNLKEGIAHIKKSFAKFLRHDYIKERVKAGLYVIETKGTEGNWNIHIHAIVYGRWLDNRVRGICPDCGQNLMKYDFISKKFYCANKKCNSLNVEVNKNSKLVELFKKSSGREVNINIQKQSSSLFSLNYMCKYISSNKDDFLTDKDTANYIMSTRKLRLISSFGLFYKCKIPNPHQICSHCGGEIHYSADQEVLAIVEMSLLKSNNSPPPSELSFYLSS